MKHEGYREVRGSRSEHLSPGKLMIIDFPPASDGDVGLGPYMHPPHPPPPPPSTCTQTHTQTHTKTNTPRKYSTVDTWHTHSLKSSS